jgi:hypothetical protein
MIYAKQLALTFSLIGIVTMRGSSVAEVEYVAPEQAVPRGKAPKMQVELLNPGEPTKQYAVIFYQGDEPFQDCWSLRRSTTLRVRTSPLSER